MLFDIRIYILLGRVHEKAEEYGLLQSLDLDLFHLYSSFKLWMSAFALLEWSQLIFTNFPQFSANLQSVSSLMIATSANLKPPSKFIQRLWYFVILIFPVQYSFEEKKQFLSIMKKHLIEKVFIQSLISKSYICFIYWALQRKANIWYLPKSQ